jgi:hypothetical protein
MNYPVSIESLHKNFPADCQVPALLVDFGSWLKSRRAGCVGYFCLQSDRFDDYWIENGADLHPMFAFFLRDPTEGRIGYWLYDGPKMVSPPIVMVGSEGDLSILSDTLEEFLKRLAEGNTHAPDLDSRDEGGEEPTKLTEWLESHTRNSRVQNAREHPDLERWMEQWGQQQRDWIDKDSLHLQIADKLRKFVKPTANPWETANFDALLVGTQFRMWHRSFGPNPMPRNEISDLEALFRSVREQRAQKVPERGLWFSSWVKIGSHGGAKLCCNFMDEPKILDERPIIPTCEYERDLIAFPRSKHWMPEWLESR